VNRRSLSLSLSLIGNLISLKVPRDYSRELITSLVHFGIIAQWNIREKREPIQIDYPLSEPYFRATLIIRYLAVARVPPISRNGARERNFASVATEGLEYAAKKETDRGGEGKGSRGSQRKGTEA